jgi:hypothetical protein
MKAPVRTKQPKKMIGGRVEVEHHDALVARAAELQITVSELVAQYVVAGLRDDAAEGSLFAALCGLKDEIRESRRDLALMAEALLVRAGTCDEQEAKEWTEANLSVE